MVGLLRHNGRPGKGVPQKSHRRARVAAVVALVCSSCASTGLVVGALLAGGSITLGEVATYAGTFSASAFVLCMTVARTWAILDKRLDERRDRPLDLAIKQQQAANLPWERRKLVAETLLKENEVREKGLDDEEAA